MILALAAALLACTASFNGGENSSDQAANGGSNGSNGSAGQVVAPTVWVREPATNAQVPAGQPVEIMVETNATTTYIMLNAGGQVASSVALPDDQSGPTTAILSWTPDREGIYNLEVFAFNGDASSAPALLVLNVSGVAAGGTGDSGGAATCTARAMVGQLNFRDGPGTDHAKLGQFDVGESVIVIGRNATTGWYQVQRFNSQQAWVINNPQWFKTEGQCDSLPVIGR